MPRSTSIPTTKTADLIAVADLHLREDVPKSRKDDFFAAMERKLDWLSDLSKKHKCPVAVAGDIFDHWKPSPYLIGWAIDHLPKEVIAVAGQHDLPQHSHALFRKSGLNVLDRSGRLIVLHEGQACGIGQRTTLYGYPFNADLAAPEKGSDAPNWIALCHYMVWKSKPPFPGAEKSGGNSRSVMKALDDFDLIITGDHHKPFIDSHGGQILVNCGAMMRMEADEGSLRPRAWLWYEKEKKVVPEYYPIAPSSEVISRDHLDKIKKKDSRTKKFAKALRKEYEAGLCYEDNLEEFMKEHDTRKSVEELVWAAVEDADQ